MTGPNDSLLAHRQEATGALELSGTPYRLIRPIGQGGMGAVYLVEDTRLRREVALKVIDTLGDEALAARLELEAQIIARLEHPNIVPVHDVGRLADGRVFYTMKFVRGERLDVWLAHGQVRTTALRIFQRICEAVAFAHHQGVVHRDLKPQNVMIGEYGEALVMDWGLAREASRSPSPLPAGAPLPLSTAELDADTVRPAGGVETIPGAALGTPGFMPPEQVRGERGADGRADVFALGAILYFLLCRRLPFEAPSVRQMLQRTLEQEPVPLRQLDSTIARPLASVCERALKKAPAERYPSAGELGTDVAAWLDGLAVRAHRETLIEWVGRWYRKYQVLVLLVFAYLVMRTVIALAGGRD